MGDVHLARQHPRAVPRAARHGNGQHCGYSKDIVLHVPGGHILKPVLKPGVPRGWPCHLCRWVSQATFPQKAEQTAPAVICNWAQLVADTGM